MEQIGRYQIIEELGRGAMGAVYRGRDFESGREVAIKSLLLGREADPLQRKRFQREASALAKVHHPNVVRLLEAGEHEGVPFLVMDFQPRGSLEDVIRRSLLPIPDVQLLGIQLAAGLEAAHAEGVLHRDLKPANVLISASGAALLTDFGLAKDLHREGQTQRLTQSGIFLGSPGYWAPEQAAAQANLVGPATDVYGLGAVLYAALTGRPPILASGLIGNLHATANERPPKLRSLRADVPARLESVVLRCLEKEVGARWVDASELKAALEGLGELDEAGGGGTGFRKVWIAGVLSLALAGSLGLLALNLSPAEQPATTPTPNLALESPPNADALYKEASALLREKQYLESVPLLKRAAALGHVKSAFKLGFIYSKGRGLAPDASAGARWYRQAIKDGHLGAMHELGVILVGGAGLPRDLVEARALFKRAAEGGRASSMARYGSLLEYGRGGPQDVQQALKWHKRSAELGDPNGMFSWGLVLDEGKTLPSDPEAAVGWYQRSVDKGLPGAMFKLAWCLETGRGIKRDQREAVRLYKRAAELGQPEAIISYAMMLELGDGAPADHGQAVAWYQRAAEANIPAGLLGLGRCYLKGRGVPVDLKRSTALFRQAAERGFAPGMVALGLALSEGRGVEASKVKAARWYRKAADLGDPNGSYSLANMLLQADGVSRDEAAAKTLLEAGVAQNHRESMHGLGGFLLRRNSGKAKVEARARSLFRRSAKLGHVDAMYNLGATLTQGIGGPRDLVEARKWFRIVVAKSKDPRIKEAAVKALQSLDRR